MKNLISTTVAALAAVALLAGCAGGSPEETSSTAEPPATSAPSEALETEPEPTDPGFVPMGEPGTVASFEYTILAVEDLGHTMEPGDGLDPEMIEYYREEGTLEEHETDAAEEAEHNTTEGAFYAVTISAKNVSGSPTGVADEAEMNLIDDQQRSFSAHLGAPDSVGEDFSWEIINPEESVERVRVYDLPAGSSPEAFEIHALGDGAAFTLED